MEASKEPSTEELLAQYAGTRDSLLREKIIERHQALVQSVAHKFVRPGVAVEDLIQSAWLALIGAVDRFDPAHGTRFSTYAVTCMVGEIKRFFRDKTWSMRMPRELQEIHAALPQMQEELSARLGRAPTVGEMAEAFRVSEEHLLQAMELGEAYQPRSLDEQREMEDGGESATLEERLGKPDAALEAVVEHAPLEAALAVLDERKQKILRLRFFEGFSQQQVADKLGLSQMHISRLERAGLKELRSALIHPEWAAGHE
jgi:RNA polymerase sigma-B factor